MVTSTNITLSFDVKSESIYYWKIRVKCDLEQNYCPPNHSIKATVIWEPEKYNRVFDVGRSYARMIKFDKRYFIETLADNETNRGHQHNAHMHSSRFQKHLYNESALSRFEVLTKPLYKCNEDRPYYATQHQDIFIQYIEGFNFGAIKASAEFKDVHLTVPEGTPPITPYTKANIRDGYVIPQQSLVYRNSEN